MRYLLLLIFLLSSLRAVVAADPTQPQSPPKRDLDIETFLSHRKADETSFEGLSMDWAVVKQLRSETFHSPLADPNRRERTTIHIGIQHGQLQLDGDGSPPERLRQLTTQLNGNMVNAVGISSLFLTRLDTRFEPRQPTLCNQPYRLLIDRNADWHIWDAVGDIRPIAAKCPAGKSAVYFKASTTARLGEIIRCATINPWGIASESQNEKEEYTLWPEAQELDGITCRILEVKSPPGTPRWSRQYWVDTADEFRLHRCVFNEEGQAIVALTYARDKSHTVDSPEAHLPRQVSILQLNKDGNVHDELVVVLKYAQRISSTTEPAVLPSLTTGTLVTDFTTGKRLLAKTHGVLAEVALDDMVSEGIVRSDADIELLDTLAAQRTIGQQLMHWLTWPYVLLPLFAVVVIYTGVSILSSRCRKQQVTTISSV